MHLTKDEKRIAKIAIPFFVQNRIVKQVGGSVKENEIRGKEQQKKHLEIKCFLYTVKLILKGIHRFSHIQQCVSVPDFRKRVVKESGILFTAAPCCSVKDLAGNTNGH